MKTTANIWLIFTVFILCNSIVLAEGTKEFRPLSTHFGNLQINDKKRPFAQESNNDSLQRLYFHIHSVTEKVFFGFNHVGAGTGTFRIKDPNGNVVYNRTAIPTAAGTGFINSYAEAVAGPRINGKPTSGYYPFTFQPATTGDFYIEFTTSLADAYHFDLFDLTVVNSLNQAIKGRLWSYAWDLNTRASANRYNGKFFVYTDDGFVSEILMNGIQPFGFVISINNTGVSNDSAGNNNNRQSINGNSTRPQFKIFLNNPDPLVYPSGKIPVIIDNLSLVGQAIYNEPVKFSINVSMASTVEVILDLNGIPKYQANSTDVILVQQVKAGPDTIVWDGKNGLGIAVDANTKIILISSSLLVGITNFPIYDAETHENGFIINKIRPIVENNAALYWDDSNFSNGQVNVDGAIKDGHRWTTNGGDERTMNTWWDGFKLDSLRSFELTMMDGTLPVELLSFVATKVNHGVQLDWVTASETNTDRFELYKGRDMNNYYMVAEVKAAGNSNIIQQYSIKDSTFMTGLFYYLLREIDYDGKQQEFETFISIDDNIQMDLKVEVVQNALQIGFNSEELINSDVVVLSISGQLLNKQNSNLSKDEAVLFNVNNQPGIKTYLVVVRNSKGKFTRLIQF